MAKSLFASFRPDPPTIGMQRVSDSCVAHAQFTWRERDVYSRIVKREVHLFEAYWAPLTEGRVTYYETLRFLAEAAFAGMKHSRFFKICQFERWMFGRVIPLDIAASTKILLVAVFLVIMINLDVTAAVPQDVIGRTRSLITFGSPLDKTAFIFRNQPNTLNDPLREQMVAASQPLLIDYRFRNRNFRWINIFPPADIISGSLDYYDDLTDPLSVSNRVQNIEDPQATTFLAAHVEYWHNDLLRDTLLKEIRRP